MQFHDCPFKILIDSREQKPWKFRGLKTNKPKELEILVDTEVRGIDPGDYTIEGHEKKVAIERKSKPDLFHCLGKDRVRFEKQIERMNEIRHAYLFVEASWESLMTGCTESRLNPRVVFRTQASWSQKYPRVHWVFCPTVRIAEAHAFRIFDTYWRHLDEH